MDGSGRATPRSLPSGGVMVTEGDGPKMATDKVGELEVQTIKLLLGGTGLGILLEAGQQVADLSIPVVLASDQPVNVVLPPGMSTEATQQQVLAELTTIDGHVDGLEAGQVSGNATLTAIAGYVDGIEALEAAGNATLTAIQGYVDGLETLVTAGNALLTDIKANTAAAPAPPANAACTAVAAAVASTVLLAANAARKGATVYNDSAAELLVRLGTPAAAATFTVDMLPGAYYEVPFGYTGQVTGIWASATGFARVTEVTP